MEKKTIKNATSCLVESSSYGFAFRNVKVRCSPLSRDGMWTGKSTDLGLGCLSPTRPLPVTLCHLSSMYIPFWLLFFFL